MRVVEVEVQLEGNLGEFEINVGREGLSATGWKAKTWLSHHQSVQFRHASISIISQGFRLGFM